jgi:hypothetical protein
MFYNALGQSVKRQALPYESTLLDIGGLPRGMYTLRWFPSLQSQVVVLD